MYIQFNLGWVNMGKRIYAKTKVCKIEDCLKSIIARGYCKKHYNIALLKGEFGSKKCVMEDCKNIAIANGYCPKHDRRVKLYGDPNYVTPRQKAAPKLPKIVKLRKKSKKPSIAFSKLKKKIDAINQEVSNIETYLNNFSDNEQPLPNHCTQLQHILEQQDALSSEPEVLFLSCRVP